MTSTRVSSDALSPDDARLLAQKAEQAGVLAQTEEEPRGRAHPDELHYEITVEQGGERLVQRYAEGNLPEEVRLLIAWVDSLPEREDSLEAPGGGSTSL